MQFSDFIDMVVYYYKLFSCVIWIVLFILFSLFLIRIQKKPKKQPVKPDPDDFENLVNRLNEFVGVLENLAMDFSKQRRLMQRSSVYHPAQELLEGYEVFFGAAEMFYKWGLVFRQEYGLMVELEAQMSLVVEGKLLKLSDLENRKEWGNIRRISREILKCMGLIKSPISNLDYSKFHYRKMIETIRGLAMDYEIQTSLVPPQLSERTARELADRFGTEYLRRYRMNQFGLISDDELGKITELDKLLEDIIHARMLALQDLETGQEWEHVRQYSRELLNTMELEIKPPVDITWADILL